MRRRRAGRAAHGFVRMPLVLALLYIGVATPALGDDDDADEQRYRELTEQASSLEAGFIYNDVNGNSPYAYGNYRGLIDDQFYVLGNVDIFRRAPWDSESSQYYRLRGLNLGLDSRYADAEYGHQGKFALRFLYDELPAYKTDTAKTFFFGIGDADLRLPSGWVPGGRADTPLPGDPGYPSAFQTSIIDNTRSFDIDWKRKKIGGGFSVVLPANLKFDANYLHETKKGNTLTSGVIAENGGDPRSVVIPQPLDFETQQLDGTLSYGGENLQLQLGYYGSTFDNDKDFLSWQVPYDGAPWDPSAGYCPDPVNNGYCGTGRKSQMPDNWFHQILASGGYNLPHRTRVTLSTAFSWMHQDDNYLPYTINQNLSVPIPLPQGDLDGEIFTTVIDFGITSRPVEKLRLDVGYRYEDRDNDTDRDVYVPVPNDAADQQPMEDGRINLPYSLTRNQVTFNAGYQLPLRSELTLGYEWEQVERDYQERKKVWSNTLSAILTARPKSFVQTRINYEHTWRDGSNYEGSHPLIDSHTTEFIDAEIADCAADGFTAQECLWENHPRMRKYYLADLHRDAINAMTTWMLREDLSITTNMSWTKDNYYNTTIGLQKFESASPGIDVTYAPFERLSTHAFYNYQWTRYKQNGWEFTNVANSTDPTTRWSSKERVDTHTVGAGFNVWVIADQLDFGVDYLYAKSTGKIDVELGSSLGPLFPYPNTKSRQHNVSVHSEYRFTENLSMRVAYLYEKLKTDDYAFDRVTQTSLVCSGNACVIGTGQKSPDYSAHAVSWSLVYKFW